MIACQRQLLSALGISEIRKRPVHRGPARSKDHHSKAQLGASLVANRIGDDPAVLWRNHTKRKPGADAKEKFASTLTALAAGILKP